MLSSKMNLVYTSLIIVLCMYSLSEAEYTVDNGNLHCTIVPDTVTNNRLLALEQAVQELQQQNVDDSWRDEVAQAACTAIQPSSGWMFAVRRPCGGSTTCATLCAGLASQDSQVNSMSCVDSLHVYKGTHPLERGLGEADMEVLGTKVFRYFYCGHRNCGPNFCCCKGN